MKNFSPLFLVLSLVLFLLHSPAAHAGEVDNYYAWGKTIKDSEQAFNEFLTDEVQQSLETVNKKNKTLQCQAVAMQIMEDLGATRYPLTYRGSLNTAMEIWAQESPLVDRVPDESVSLDDYAAQSIYAPAMRTAGVKTDLDHIVNINGYYFGTDKISHFLGSGFEYYRRYLKAVKNTSEAMAESDSIMWAIGMESGLLGMKVVGVFSYADLEANYQGLKFARDLCEGESAILKMNDKKWQLNQPITIAKYVNPNWDESFNLSTYSNSRLKKVLKNMTGSQLCQQENSAWVKQQRAYYQRHSASIEGQLSLVNTSFSARLLHAAQQNNQLSPDDFETVENRYQLGLTQAELNQFISEAELPQQRDFTLQVLCQE